MLVLLPIVSYILLLSSNVFGGRVFSAQKIAANECGQTFYAPRLPSSNRIVNGLEAVSHSFPWTVSLQYKEQKGVHYCGGVIIDQWHILTAAHCLDNENDLWNHYVRVGAHNRLSSGRLIPIARVIKPSDYDAQLQTNDIGIIKLATPITFSQQVQPICLVENNAEPPLGTTVYVAGWGDTVYQKRNSSSLILLQARLRVISDCSPYPAFERQKQLCIAPNGPVGEDHGSCQGDSGGALLYLKFGRWYAGGVVSHAIECGRPEFPTVYTKTAAYINWIRAVINRPVSS